MHYWYLNIFNYSPSDQNIFTNIFSLFCSIFFSKMSAFKCIFTKKNYFGPLIYSNICSNFGLKYIQIFLHEVFNLSNIFAYLFVEVLVIWIYLNICLDPFSNICSSLLYSDLIFFNVPSWYTIDSVEFLKTNYTNILLIT